MILHLFLLQAQHKRRLKKLEEDAKSNRGNTLADDNYTQNDGLIQIMAGHPASVRSSSRISMDSRKGAGVVMDGISNNRSSDDSESLSGGDDDDNADEKREIFSEAQTLLKLITQSTVTLNESAGDTEAADERRGTSPEDGSLEGLHGVNSLNLNVNLTDLESQEVEVQAQTRNLCSNDVPSYRSNISEASAEKTLTAALPQQNILLVEKVVEFFDDQNKKMHSNETLIASDNAPDISQACIEAKIVDASGKNLRDSSMPTLTKDDRDTIDSLPNEDEINQDQMSVYNYDIRAADLRDNVEECIVTNTTRNENDTGKHTELFDDDVDADDGGIRGSDDSANENVNINSNINDEEDDEEEEDDLIAPDGFLLPTSHTLPMPDPRKNNIGVVLAKNQPERPADELIPVSDLKKVGISKAKSQHKSKERLPRTRIADSSRLSVHYEHIGMIFAAAYSALGPKYVCNTHNINIRLFSVCFYMLSCMFGCVWKAS